MLKLLAVLLEEPGGWKREVPEQESESYTTRSSLRGNLTLKKWAPDKWEMKTSLSDRTIFSRAWGHVGLRSLLLSKDGVERCLCSAGRGPAAEVT